MLSEQSLSDLCSKRLIFLTIHIMKIVATSFLGHLGFEPDLFGFEADLCSQMAYTASKPLWRHLCIEDMVLRRAVDFQERSYSAGMVYLLFDMGLIVKSDAVSLKANGLTRQV